MQRNEGREGKEENASGSFFTLVHAQEDPPQVELLHELSNIPMHDESIHVYLCPISRRLMRDPVRINDPRFSQHVYEREFVLSLPNVQSIELIDAVDIRLQIDNVILQRPHLAHFRYLPSAWIIDMHVACLSGNRDQILALAQRDRRLLFAPHPQTGYLPVHTAIFNENNLLFIMQLLEQHQPGFGLMCLQYKAGPHQQIPLEYALHHSDSLNVIVKLMEWMGQTLSFFHLTTPICIRRKPILNAILLICILRVHRESAEQAVGWGADVYSSLANITPLLMQVANQADRNILLAVVKEYNPELTDINQLNSDNVFRGILRYRTIHDISMMLTMKKIGNLSTLTEMDSSSDEQVIHALDKLKLAVLNQENKQQSLAAEFKIFPTSAKSPASLPDFLVAVSSGEQDRAEKMLQFNPKLAFMPGEIKDLSERTFPNMTGFQYALWSLDMPMCQMILEYLPEDEAKKQYQALESNGTSHGFYFDPKVYLDAIDTYIKGVRERSVSDNIEFWCKKVGGAQRLFPAYFVNEFCRHDKTFNPARTFSDDTLPRTRHVNMTATTNHDDWFTARFSGGRLGEAFAIHRAGSNFAQATAFSKQLLKYDRDCIRQLFLTRLEERKNLFDCTKKLKLK